MSASCLYDLTVTHHRARPRPYALRHRIVAMLLDLDELPALSRRLRLFSAGMPSPVRFRAADHGGQTASGLRGWVEARLAEAGIAPPGGPIRLLCMPRLFGHAFNPLSVFFCHRPDGGLGAVVYEVRSTFGERHHYLLPFAEGTDQSCDKRLHVSPFLPMSLRYRFRLHAPGERLSLGIACVETASGDVVLRAAMAGHRRALTDRALLGLLARRPAAGLGVLGAIHVHALRLWRLGTPFHAKPPPGPPTTVGVTVGATVGATGREMVA